MDGSCLVQTLKPNIGPRYVERAPKHSNQPQGQWRLGGLCLGYPPVEPGYLYARYTHNPQRPGGGPLRNDPFRFWWRGRGLEVHAKQASKQAGNQPTNQPTIQPIMQPTKQPNSQTTNQPTNQTASQLTHQTTSQPTKHQPSN